VIKTEGRVILSDDNWSCVNRVGARYPGDRGGWKERLGIGQHTLVDQIRRNLIVGKRIADELSRIVGIRPRGKGIVDGNHLSLGIDQTAEVSA